MDGDKRVSAEAAIVLTNGQYRQIHAKTAHGLVRGPSRYRIVAVVDSSCAGADAGKLLDGRCRDIPVVESVDAAIDGAEERIEYCVVGVATKGGAVPPSLRGDLLAAGRAGLSIVNGLHELLVDDPELLELVESNGARILDIRRPRPVTELRFWTGEVLQSATPRVAVLGTDCALGKRTTATMLETALGRRGIRGEMVYTGQTGWLQGRRFGFIFDATPNDFVPGELERAILECDREARPDVILLEGQSGLRNPCGPCGSELIVSAGAAGVILQHAPGRPYFKGFEKQGLVMAPLDEEIELIRLFGSEAWAVAIHEEGLPSGEVGAVCRKLTSQIGVPVCAPLRDEAEELAGVVQDRLKERSAR